MLLFYGYILLIRLGYITFTCQLYYWYFRGISMIYFGYNIISGILQMSVKLFTNIFGIFQWYSFTNCLDILLIFFITLLICLTVTRVVATVSSLSTRQIKQSAHRQYTLMWPLLTYTSNINTQHFYFVPLFWLPWHMQCSCFSFTLVHQPFSQPKTLCEQQFSEVQHSTALTERV